ncbi:MAG: hypothetical protein LM593_02935 [Candidatus Verstraetearchaeota archaeon]|jgi:DNA repair exonuclease SbcCD ATPase subunit|nr:hypothetical protein [Candidatus Verstraetearchaeota archaeon]
MKRLNFSYIKENNEIRALPDYVGDVIAILKGLDISSKVSSYIRFFNEEKIRKIDAIYKFYYPIFIVSKNNNIICIDGLELHKTEIKEFLIKSREVSIKVHEFNLLEVDNIICQEYIVIDDEINDGFAIPCTLSKEDVISITNEVLRVYTSLNELLVNIEKEISKLEEEYNQKINSIRERKNRIIKEFDEKIKEKESIIENLLLECEKRDISKVKSEILKQKNVLNNEKENIITILNNLNKELTEVINKIDSKNKNLLDLRKRISKLSKKRDKIIIIKNKVKNIEKINKLIKKLDIIEKELERLNNEEFAILNELKNLENKKNSLENRIKELNKDLSKILEEIRFLQCKEDLECRRIREEYIKNRETAIEELNSIINDKEKALIELEIEENHIKFEYIRNKEKYDKIINLIKKEIDNLEKYVYKSENHHDDIKLIYIPYYGIIRKADVDIVEPFVIIDNKKIKSRKLNLDSKIVKAVFTKYLPLLLFEAKDVFNILKKKDRILQGINVLKEEKVINKIQESIILRRIL